MYKTALSTIEKHNMLSKGDRIITALSGGPDSMALLFFLCELRELKEIEVFAVHLNHKIRGAEAERDKEFVRDYCRDKRIELLVFEKDVPFLASENKITIEEAGRLARYEAFAKAAVYLNADSAAIGHNKNDVAETFLLNLLRGAGARGLSGIAPTSVRKGLRVIRPLINCGREQIEEYCRINCIPYITDSSNNESHYTRNKIRLDVLPCLKSVNEDAVNAIVAAAAILSEQNALLEKIAETAFAECLRHKGVDALSIDINTLDKYHEALKKLIIRESIKTLTGNLTNIEAVHINDILSLCRKQTGRRISLPGNVMCERSYDCIVFGKRLPKTAAERYHLSETPVLINEINVYATFSDRQMQLKYKNLCTKAIKCDKILSKVEYRSRLPGDRIKLPGGTKKLSDFFTDRKIPRAQRDTIPLLADGKDILCVLDVCDSEWAKHGEHEYYLQFWGVTWKQSES